MRSIYEDLFDSPADFDEDDYDDDGYEVEFKVIPPDSSVINVRTVADGASTLTELADMLRIYADHIEYMVESGYELYEDIVGGQGYAYKEPENEGVANTWAN